MNDVKFAGVTLEVVTQVEIGIIQSENKKVLDNECAGASKIFLITDRIAVRFSKFKDDFIANDLFANDCIACNHKECVTPITNHTLTYTTTSGPYNITDLNGDFCHLCEYFVPDEDSKELLEAAKRKIRFGALPPVEESIVFDSTQKTGFCSSKLEKAYELSKKLETLQNQLKTSESVNEISLIINGSAVFIHQNNFLHTGIREYLQVCADTKVRELEGLGVDFNA